MPLCAYVEALGFIGPGVSTWPALARRLMGEPADPAAPAVVEPQCLSARAARRLSPQSRLALAVAEQVASGLPEDAAWVFASSCGEGETLHVILEAISTAEMLVQPLRFQNAVHNAAAGQWTIAMGRTAPATSIAAFDETMGAGVLKALLQVTQEDCAVGLIGFDVPLPAPLDEKRPLGIPLAVAFALAPTPSPQTIARLRASLGDQPPSPARTDFGRTLVGSGNPVAAVLPLLELMAGPATSARDARCALGLSGAVNLQLEVLAP